VRQETGKMREGLQSVVRSVNPLARLLDFLQEDIESMQVELERWRSAKEDNQALLKAEKR
jgi:TRAF3-interacting protein 1